MVAIIIVRFVRSIKRCLDNSDIVFFEMGKEEEMFWIPGDKITKRVDEYEYDDFEDL